MRRTKVKGNKSGITLIALVITIVILIILSGITLNLVLGNNGIITRTKDAKIETRGATVEERRDLWKATMKTDDIIGGDSTAQSLDDLLTDLRSQNLLTDDEVTTIKSVGYITIGSRTIDFRSDESQMIPGLYQTGTTNLIKSWDQLKTDGDIVVEDVEGGKKLTSISSSLVGDLYISNEITELGRYSPDHGSSYNLLCGVSSSIQITGLYIPSSIKDIPYASFAGMNELKSVILENGVQNIENYAFLYSRNLINIKIPSSVTSIGDYSFCECSSLESITIPSSVTNIGYEAFDNCSSLTNITIPSSVTSIGYYAFVGCFNLKSIDVDINNQNYTSENGILYDINKTILIEYPSKKADVSKYEIPDSVTSIGDGAFLICTSLSNITIPSSVTSIGRYAFRGCTSLSNITIPSSVTSVGACAFQGCTALSNITIPDSVTSIEWYAFYEWTSAQTINCQAASKPSGWDSGWNLWCDAVINWNVTP